MPGLPPYKVTVSYPPGGHPPGYGFDLYRPQSGMMSGGLGVRALGFVVRTSPLLGRPVRVSVRVGGVEMAGSVLDVPRPDVLAAPRFAGHVPEGDLHCGFDLLLPSFLSRREAPIDLVAVLATAETAELREFKLASVHFTPEMSEAPRDPIGVLTVNSIGRSGSSLFCRLLNAHPSFCVPTFGGQFGEVFILGHYARAIAVLSAEASPRELNKPLNEPDYMSLPLGFMLMDDPRGGRDMQLAQELMAIGFDAGRQMLLNASEIVAAHMRRTKPTATVWVEKTWNSKTVNIASQLLRRWHDVILVREPRDFWRSQHLYLKKLNIRDDDIHHHLSGTFGKLYHLANTIADMGDRALIIRYEDLIAEPAREIGRVLRRMELPSAEECGVDFGALAGERDLLRERQATGDARSDEDVLFDDYMASRSRDERISMERVYERLGYAQGASIATGPSARS